MGIGFTVLPLQHERSHEWICLPEFWVMVTSYHFNSASSHSQGSESSSMASIDSCLTEPGNSQPNLRQGYKVIFLQRRGNILHKPVFFAQFDHLGKKIVVCLARPPHLSEFLPDLFGDGYSFGETHGNGVTVAHILICVKAPAGAPQMCSRVCVMHRKLCDRSGIPGA